MPAILYSKIIRLHYDVSTPRVTKKFSLNILMQKNEFKRQHKFELIYYFIDEKSSEYEEQQ